MGKMMAIHARPHHDIRVTMNSRKIAPSIAGLGVEPADMARAGASGEADRPLDADICDIFGRTQSAGRLARAARPSTLRGRPSPTLSYME